MKSVLAFDLDGTLAPSKSPVQPAMATLISEILEDYDVCVISGGSFEQFKTQLLSGLKLNEKAYARLHLMPTCGTQYYRYDNKKGWTQVYAENFMADERDLIMSVLNEGVDMLGYREDRVYGETIEDRGSQITFSALGQDVVSELGDAGVLLKEQWDPTHTKKDKLRNYVADRLPDFEVRVGGGTSIDITKPGIDKAYGMVKLMDMLDIQKEDILFFGDRLEEGGNDYPVRAMGIASLQVKDWEDTARRLETVLLLR